MTNPRIDPPLKFDHLTRRFRGLIALQDVTFEVPPHSVVGLLGRNSAGKSTLLQCAVGLLKPSAGTIRLFEQDPWSLDAEGKSRLGFVPQRIALHSWMRVQQMLDYHAAFYPRWNGSLVHRLLDEWDLPNDRRIKTLSPGALQKLAIILALAHEPEMLILDEPAAALDPSARRQFLGELLDLAADGRRTILFSTHITSDLERVADHVALLRKGRLVFFGGLDDLKERVKRLHITSPAPLSADFDLPGSLRCQVQGYEALVSVKMGEQDLVEYLQREFAAQVQVEDLNLEEIFLEMQHA